ncbi:MAG: energy-coupling factor transporter transmembrane component T [Treponema sp.]|nr:energy-coupling factor transporter transmembrane component T [Treponema sp.]
MAVRERYEPRRDKGRYLEKSLLAVLGVLAALRDRPGESGRRDRVRPELKLASTFMLILLVSLSRNSLFIEAAAAVELGLLCLFRGEVIARVLRKVAAAAVFAAAVFLPAFLWGRGGNVLFLLGKVLLAVLAAAIFSAATPWTSVTEAFSRLRVPDVFVMTLDMTIKYISLLGGLVLNMLYALKLRSVGRNERKMHSLAAIAGTLFLKSRDAAVTQYQAMECRCFSGTYRITRASAWSPFDAGLAALDAVLAAAFFALGAWR